MRDRFSNIAIFVYLTCVILFYFDRALSIPLAGVLAIHGVVILFTQLKYAYRNHRVMLLVFLGTSLVTFFACLIQERSLISAPRQLFQFALLILIIRYNINPSVVRYILYLYIFYVLFAVLIRGVDPNYILMDASRNHVAWHGLVLGIFYYSVVKARGGKIEIYTALLVLFLALVCLGRSTIIASSLLLLAVLYQRGMNYSRFSKVLTGLLFITAIALIYNGFQIFFDEKLQRFTEKKLESDERDFLISSYLDKIDGTTFFSGVSPFQYPFSIYGNTLHNSFLWAHAHFGFLLFAFFALLLVTFLKGGIFNYVFWKLLLLSFILRVYVDVVAFIGWYDFICYYIIYNILMSKKRELPAKLEEQLNLEKNLALE